jgi:hypothetical protein
MTDGSGSEETANQPQPKCVSTHAQALKFNRQPKAYADGEKRTPVG